MSIFDDLTRDSFLSKKAAGKQSSAARRKRDAEIASEFAEKKDAEVARDAVSGAKSRGFSIAPGQREGTPASDNSGIAMNASGNNADTEFGSDMAGVAQYGTQLFHAGVSFDKLSSEARIYYSGLLSKSGADRVIAYTAMAATRTGRMYPRSSDQGHHGQLCDNNHEGQKYQLCFQDTAKLG